MASGGPRLPCSNQVSPMIAPDSESECPFKQGGNVSIFVVEVMQTDFQCILLATVESVTNASSDLRGGATYGNLLKLLQTGFKVSVLVTDSSFYHLNVS